MLRKYIDEKNYKRIKAGISKMKKTDAIFSHLDGTYLHPDVLGDNYRKCIKGTPLEDLDCMILDILTRPG